MTYLVKKLLPKLMRHGRAARLPLPSSTPARSPVDNEQAPLRFTRELNEYRSVERLLQVLPSKLRDLISANTFIVSTIDGTQGRFHGPIDGHLDGHVDIGWTQQSLPRVHKTHDAYVDSFAEREKNFGGEKLPSAGSGFFRAD